MGAFFKTCGKGILYVLGLPLFLIVIAIYSVVGLVIFIIVFVKWAILFFSGRSLYSDLEEDVEVKKIIEANNQQATQPVSETKDASTPTPLSDPQIIEVINVQQNPIENPDINNSQLEDNQGPALIDIPEIKEDKNE